MIRIKWVIIYLLLTFSVFTFADEKKIEVGIDEKLGAYIPVDLKFRNADGDTVHLNELLNKPAILALVYYDCPGVCHPLLAGLSELVDRIDMQPGTDFNVITLSFDHSEKPHTASRWKREHLNSLKRNIPKSSWSFLTGDSISISRLTDAVGFYFKKDSNNTFLHSGALIVLSEKGMISRYIFGSIFLPFDVKMALIEAQRGEFKPTVNKILQFCYSYERQGNTYVFNVKKVFGGAMILIVAILFITLTIRSKAKKAKRGIING